MRLDNSLDDLFATGSHVRVLRALDRLPEGLTVSGREIARRAGVSQPTAADVLRSLEAQGLLVVGRRLRAAFYRLNSRHVLTPAIRLLFARERTVRSELESVVADRVYGFKDVTAAYLFGSAARGDMSAESDIDVAVQAKDDLPEEIGSLDEVHQRFGNRVSVIRLRARGASGLRASVKREGRLLPRKREPKSG